MSVCEIGWQPGTQNNAQLTQTIQQIVRIHEEKKTTQEDILNRILRKTVSMHLYHICEIRANRGRPSIIIYQHERAVRIDCFSSHNPRFPSKT